MGISGVSGNQGYGGPLKDPGNGEAIRKLLNEYLHNPLDGKVLKELRKALGDYLNDPTIPNAQKEVAINVIDDLKKYDQYSQLIQGYKQALEQPGLSQDEIDSLEGQLHHAVNQQQDISNDMVHQAQNLI